MTEQSPATCPGTPERTATPHEGRISLAAVLGITMLSVGPSAAVRPADVQIQPGPTRWITSPSAAKIAAAIGRGNGLEYA